MSVQGRFWAKVDDWSSDKGCWLWTGSGLPSGYGQISIDSIKVYVHRLSYEWEYGLIPEGVKIDHTCHDKSCVNPAHLRLATTSQNAQNRKHYGGRGKSGYVGVTWVSASSKWVARVRVNGKVKHLGVFDDVHEAGEAARQGRLKYHTYNDIDRE